MALYITFKNHYGPREVIWHVGGVKPFKQDGLETIATIQADGDELEFLETNFYGIPFVSKKNIVTWRGEMAEFIFDNL